MKSSDDEDEKANVLSNMGVMLVFALALALIFIVVFLLVRFCKNRIRAQIEKFKRKLMWNSVIRYVLQGYL